MASQSTHRISSDSEASNNSITSNISNNTTSKDYSKSKYNQSSYQLPIDTESTIYIFQHQLFKRSLLPINIDKERQMLVECTTCKFKKIEQVKGFQASNYARHYRLKHPNIAYNKESEKTRVKKTI
jgi:hypothetical protein